jgi:hypothetical protein
MLAWYWYTQAAVFSFRNTNVLNQGFRKGDRGALATYKHDSRAVGDPCDTDTTRQNMTKDQPSPQQAQTHSCRSCLVEGMGGLHPFPPPHPEHGPSTVPHTSCSCLSHTYTVCSLPSPLQESPSTHHPCPSPLSMWLSENIDGGHPAPILQLQGTGINLHTRKPRKTTPTTTSAPQPTASCPSSYSHCTCTCS